MSTADRYGKVTADVLESLVAALGQENVLVGDDRMNYSRDEAPNTFPMMPDVVVRPGSAASVSAVLRLANERRIPVTPRGAGTGLSGGAVPIYGGIVLSTERMNRIVDVDDANFTATVEPGVVLTTLYEAVAKQGLYYPPYPGELTATIGGNVATNAGGMRAVKYGVTRNFLLGLEAVLPTGEVIETGGRFIKSSTAYDLTQLIAGSEGTLAVITRVELKLLPPPGQRFVVLAPFNSLEDAINTVPPILRQSALPMGIEFIEKEVVQLIEQFRGRETPIHSFEASLMIIVEAEGEDGANVVCSDIGHICMAHGAVDVFIAGGERAIDLLTFREKAWPAIVHGGHADMADVVVPRSRIAEFVQRARHASRELGITTFMVGHAGDGNVHVSPIVPEESDAGARMSAFFHRLFELGVSMGGTISGEHGIGYTKKPYIDIALPGSKLELMRRIKRAFDPNNIMNPGKIFDL
jgi:glycolate oxidase